MGAGSSAGRGGTGRLAGAFSLAGWEIRRTWPSYLQGVLLLLFCGFLVVPVLSGVFEFEGFGPGGVRMEDLYNDLLADGFFLWVCGFLAVNALVRRDTRPSKLLFLRELPISAVSVVAGRMLSMLLALAINALAFFLPAYFLTGYGGDLGPSYLWFAGVWVGYGLLASGLYLHFEFAAGRGGYVAFCAGLVVAFVSVVALLEWMVDLGLVGRTMELVGVYGALPAILSLSAGVVAFVLLARATVLSLQRREVFGEPFA